MKNLLTIDKPTRVPIDQAAAYSDAGEWLDNPRMGEHGQQPILFRSSYSVLYRPNPAVQERHQYAIVAPV